ncbi:U1 small nuclear ribonucleoprotein C-like [Anneissia japonica]|uniref:U1 small nuclear ribonucleoprotein C-like n=1 Tax=Anneissia japonica TaxID=1529436 RepID=UPI001425AFDA|nr:U1 small nuclear ribonucleoprotein C-like [Anneissia japonica]
MPKYYCDYCDTYLTHDSPSVRKTHCTGRKHKENVRIYYQKWMEEQAQNLIDRTTAAYQAGKIQHNPFPGAAGVPPGGSAIPPPANYAPGGPRPVGPGGQVRGPPPGMGPPPGLLMRPPGPGGPMMRPMGSGPLLGPMPPMGPGMMPPRMLSAPRMPVSTEQK